MSLQAGEVVGGAVAVDNLLDRGEGGAVVGHLDPVVLGVGGFPAELDPVDRGRLTEIDPDPLRISTFGAGPAGRRTAVDRTIGAEGGVFEARGDGRFLLREQHVRGRPGIGGGATEGGDQRER